MDSVTLRRTHFKLGDYQNPYSTTSLEQSKALLAQGSQPAQLDEEVKNDLRKSHFVLGNNQPVFKTISQEEFYDKSKYNNPDNVDFKKVDIMNIKAKDDSFDVVIAGNVIHLLPDPQSAMKELARVCKDGGRLIIPTYINGDEGTNKLAVKFLEKLGANFKRQFDAESYEKFFEDMGYKDVVYEVVRGRMSCDIAIIDIKKN